MAESLEDNVTPTGSSVRHRFTVDEFYRLGEADAFHPEARIELIDGELMDMAPIRSRHAGSMDLLTRWFIEQVPQEITVR